MPSAFPQISIADIARSLTGRKITEKNPIIFFTHGNSMHLTWKLAATYIESY